MKVFLGNKKLCALFQEYIEEYMYLLDAVYRDVLLFTFYENI